MNKKRFLYPALAGLLALQTFPVTAQDTFSIVAVDSATGEVGSAGASCVDLAAAGIADPSFISELLPGKGAINTQSYYLAANQDGARNRMNAGDTPAQIIAWLQANDAQSDNTIRQYGIAALVGGSPQTAAFTGSNCISYAGHIIGHNYSIQGNILLGKKVLDSMEARFNRETGSLACKLMAALQGAKMVGADTRCASNNSSALFAFLKVSKPGDPFGNPSVKVGVLTPANAQIEPIDSLQVLVDNMGLCNTTGLQENEFNSDGIGIVPNPASGVISITNNSSRRISRVAISDASGRVVLSSSGTQHMDIHHLAQGIYFVDVAMAGTDKRIRLKLVKYP